MLYRIIIDNFRSYSSPVEFNMFPNTNYPFFENHINNEEGVPVVKMSAIYGANGAGKSNFIKAIQTIKHICTRRLDRKVSWKDLYRSEHYCLEENNTRPIVFYVEFSKKGFVYIYNVNIKSDGTLSESLYISGLGKTNNELLYKRENGIIEFNKIEVSPALWDIIKMQVKIHRNVPFFQINGMLHLLSDNHLKNVYSWFGKDLDIITTNQAVPWIIDLLSKQKDMMSYIGKIFGEIGLGIESLSIKEQKFEDWVLNHEELRTGLNSDFSKEEYQEVVHFKGERPLCSITENEGRRIVREFIFKQIGTQEKSYEMDIEKQSDGTVRLLTLLPAIYRAIMSPDACIFIDEIDRCIHPLLMKNLISLVGRTDCKGQLIFTTHETVLLNQKELLRPDEVWFIEKAKGQSIIYSLNDFKLSNDIVIENGYLQGRFGAIPFIGTLS